MTFQTHNIITDNKFYFIIAIDCGDPDEPDDNGDVSFDSTTFGSTATYSCDDGFLLDDSQGGSEVVTCLASGVWSDTAPACIRKEK